MGSDKPSPHDFPVPVNLDHVKWYLTWHSAFYRQYLVGGFNHLEK